MPDLEHASRLGLGAGRIGDPAQDEREVEHLLRGALDLGVTVIDSARSYGLSEERIGRALAGRRGSFLLSTKVGYDMAPHPDWTGACVAAGVDAALARLRTDVIDVVHLHSCPREILQRGEVVRALEDAVAAGKVRRAGYAGDGEAARSAVDSGRFAALETSVSLLDQASLAATVPAAAARGLLVIAKRPLADAPWRWSEPPAAPDSAEYHRRFRALDLDALRGGLEWGELAVRFAAFAPGVTTAIVGTSRLAHLARAAGWVARGPLPDDQAAALRAAFPPDWPGII
ncbi:MAG TPA: aldo/keto reductase [Kofleriaceae bacterium]|nr:aldo/keto reductase [Kofleriaceae bacterium]